MDVNYVLQAESEPFRAYSVLVKRALIISIDEMVNWRKKSMERMQIHDLGCRFVIDWREYTPIHRVVGGVLNKP